MFVLITVPHGFCLDQASERMCDIRATECARILERLLQVKHKTIHSHIPRSVVDLNRSPSAAVHPEWNKFNKRIISALQQHQKKNIILVDVHSFPKGSFDTAQIAIIDVMNKERPELRLLVDKVKRELKIDIQLFNGGVNYIQNTYERHSYPILLEFCEDADYLKAGEIKLFFKLFIDFFGLI
jgi:hypothetical protein